MNISNINSHMISYMTIIVYNCRWRKKKPYFYVLKKKQLFTILAQIDQFKH